jgi:hypothetical protein
MICGFRGLGIDSTNEVAVVRDWVVAILVNPFGMVVACGRLVDLLGNVSFRFVMAVPGVYRRRFGR